MEDSDTTCSAFGFIPKSPSCRIVRCGCSLVSLERDLDGTLVLFLALRNKMALKSAIIIPKNSMPKIVWTTLTNKSELHRNNF